MKRLAVLSLTVGLFGVPIQAQAQQYGSSTPVQVQVQFYGSPAQTPADCYLGVTHFMAAVVMGINVIYVTPQMRQFWNNKLIANYEAFSLDEQYELANACVTFANLTKLWPQMNAVARERERQIWASLPGVLQVIEPQSRPAQQNAIPSATRNSDPIAGLDRIRKNKDAVSKIGTQNVINTIGLMHAMTPPPPRRR
jgi:hypothetical protein